MEPQWLTARDGGALVQLRVTAGARSSEVIDATGEQLRIRIAAPAVEGKANAAVMRFVADLFGVRRSEVELIRGERSRDKVVKVRGVEGPPRLQREL